MFTLRERDEDLNKMNEAGLVDRVTAALQNLGLTVLARKEPGGAGKHRADAWLRIGKDGERTDYIAEAKRAVTPGTLGAIVAQLRYLATSGDRPTLLITDYLTPPVAEKLRAQGQQFADAAGNAYLEAPGLLVYVTGRKPQERVARKAGQTFTINGLKILFVLICDPELAGAPQRAIAMAAGVALGAVPGVLADLQAAGHLLVAGRNRKLNATRRLLDEWALAYARRLRPRTLLATYHTPNFHTWKDWEFDVDHVRWGGEPAAHLLVRHLKPGVLTLYAKKLPPKLIAEQKLTRVGPLLPPNFVEVREPFWGHTLHGETLPEAVPPALVYADLLATGEGRCIETAQMVYERYLARLLPAA